MATSDQCAVVAIGRNEGERLRRCLASVANAAGLVVYVDSGSSDDSVAMARANGVEVVELDMSIPFTAARARNEGFHRLRELRPDLPYVQFVDGDCEIVAGWMEAALRFLKDHNEVAVVCGRRRERYPDASPYNQLCDIEWDTPVGQAQACGGDAMMRADAFERASGFRPDLIAGEEPELCLRLRQAGWKIWRVDVEMTLHDAAMQRFGQWWRRTTRAGFAYAANAFLHGALPERHRVRECRRIWIWGLGIPVIALVAASIAGAWGATVLLAYPLQILRLAVRGTRSPRANWLYALSLVGGKFPEVLGQLRFLYGRLSGRANALIEYK